MALVRFIKDPDAVLDYTLDWTDWLAEGDTLTAVSFTTPAPLELTSETFLVGALPWAPDLGPRWLTQVWVHSGSAGNLYEVICHVTASSGRQDDRTFVIVCREK